MARTCTKPDEPSRWRHERVRHYVLTRSAYGPEWNENANRRRLTMTRAVTARLMAQQTTKDWTWIVAVHPADPLLEERLDVFRSAGVEVRPIMWEPTILAPAPWDGNGPRTTPVQKAAATAYKAPWRAQMDPGSVLQTRIDDDDGFAPDALARLQRAARELTSRHVLMLPEGFRVASGRFVRVYQPNNAMHSLFTPENDPLCIYDYGHMQTWSGGHSDLPPRVRPPRSRPNPKAPAPVVFVDDQPGWLWVRHRDTISGHHKAWLPISSSLKRMFPIDWSVL